MNRFPVILLLATLDVVPMLAQRPKYPPLSEYMMARDAEIALAKSAAPGYVTDHATIKIFTASGFQTVHEGDNGFVCAVMRGSLEHRHILRPRSGTTSITTQRSGRPFVSIH